MALDRAEVARKLVHIAAGAFALPFRWFSWREAALTALAALVFNWLVLPAVGGRALWRRGEQGRPYDLGILLYPAAVLALVLVFHDRLWAAAAVWGVLAWGDGMASLVGQWAGGPKLPWNPRKTWSGLLAFVVFGTAAAALLTAWTTALPLSAALAPWALAGSLALALACAAAESLPWGIDDNLTVPLAGAVTMVALGYLKAGGMPEAVPPPGTAAVAGATIALLAYRAGALDVAGALSTAILGGVIAAALGWAALATIATFFVLGSAATRAGYARKAAVGLAQERGGARGWRSAWANGAVPAACAAAAALAPPPQRPLWVLAYVAAVATAAADTASSEIGRAYGGRPVKITTLRPAAPGDPGGVSLPGSLAGLGAAAAVAAVAAVLGLCTPRAAALAAIAGFAGGLAESALAALPFTRRIGDHALNVANTAIGAAIAVTLARLCG